MLKPLQTDYKGHSITLECTYKKVWPPPQMYGHTPDDIDIMWKQGTIDAALHQQLATWKDKCGLMVMGPRCLDCPLAKFQKPRPGRPHVIQTEPWLERKEQMHWEDMKRSADVAKAEAAQQAEEESAEEESAEEPEYEGDKTFVNEDLSNDEVTAQLSPKEESKKDIADERVEKSILDSEPEPSPSPEPDKKPLADDDDDVIAALAED